MLKSNQGVFEEVTRLSAYLDEEPVIIGCPAEDCANVTVDVKSGTVSYSKFGETDSGSQRYQCKLCKKTFSVSSRPIDRQRVSHKNKTILKLLMNKSPFSRICEVMEISMPTLYRKIDFIHRQCLLFVAEKERKLLTGQVPVDRLYLATDRQEYFVNWTNTFDKRHVVLKGIGTADLTSGYVFGMHTNYDPRLDPRVVQEIAAHNGDESKDMALREFARIWLEIDHERIKRRPPKIDPNPIPEGALAHLYYKASLHKIDSFFNQIRARLNPLGQPTKSMSNQGRSYLRYQLYKPGIAQQLLDVFRVYHNYHLKSDDDKKTPAMRLGLTRAPISIDDIINFRIDKKSPL